jgi:hypothetical protein
MGLGGLRSMILMLADEPSSWRRVRQANRWRRCCSFGESPTRLLPSRVESCLTPYRRIGISSDEQEMFRGLQDDGAGGGKAPGSSTSRIAPRDWSSRRCRGSGAVRINCVSADKLSGADRATSGKPGWTACGRGRHPVCVKQDIRGLSAGKVAIASGG